jgi:hypothetical protein
MPIPMVGIPVVPALTALAMQAQSVAAMSLTWTAGAKRSAMCGGSCAHSQGVGWNPDSAQWPVVHAEAYGT